MAAPGGLPTFAADRQLTLPLLTSKLGGLSYFRIRQWLLQKDQTGAYSH
jgi:hypothetical protein